MIRQSLDKLQEMRLHGMVEGLSQQLEQPAAQGLSFEERFDLLVDQEYTYRRNRRLARLLKEARLRLDASPEDIDYHHPRGLDRHLMMTLATSEWIRLHQNLLITGPTGTGKTYVACALANAACRQGLSCRYYRMPRLLSDLLTARGDGSYPKLLTKLAKIQLLILDDWGLAPLAPQEARDMLEIIDDRSEARSTLIAAQLPVAQWHQTIDDPTVADAILDRLLHHAHQIVLRGESMRKTTNNASTTE
jgi:DNA replication protein DnaC